MAANSVTPFCLPQGSQAKLERIGNTYRPAKRPTGIQGPTSGWINPDAPINHDYVAADPRRWLSATYEAGAECDGYAPKDAVASSHGEGEEHDLGYVSDEELRGAGVVSDLAKAAWKHGKTLVKEVGKHFVKHAAEKVKEAVFNKGQEALDHLKDKGKKALEDTKEKARKYAEDTKAHVQEQVEQHVGKAKQQAQAYADSAREQVQSHVSKARDTVDHHVSRARDAVEHVKTSAADRAHAAHAELQKAQKRAAALAALAELDEDEEGGAFMPYRPPPNYPLTGVTAHATWKDLNKHDRKPRFTEVPTAGTKRRRAPPKPNARSRSRGALVSKIMKEHGVSLAEASRHIKGKGLPY